ncbi:hypothetical protein [Natronolimnohabitans innermongolicus]|uniref:Uncharacterized protein n=1 Tax=Natronolimnohabitans innermongolicus JCM 12255 TaxID=1227499 RepID=L9WSS0_9EURY|nr:hypothetical protein [Natronolimnohabitans innermongolicus]ELY52482.1 hypothetical protein C493_15575 [Natronolimnohabitans innermongolicus JCM 12255]
MSLFGTCEDCSESANLRYKPDMSHDAQARPSICNRCRIRREERMLEQVQEERPVPPHVPSVPEERGDGE